MLNHYQRKILAEAAKHGGANISVPEQMAEAANAHQFRVGDAVQTTYNGKSVRGVVVKVGKDALMIDIGSRKYDIAKHKDEVRYLPNVKIEPTLQDESVEEETVTEARKMGKRQLRKAVDDVFNKHFNGVPVPLMKLVAIFKEIEAAIVSGADPEKAMVEIKKKHGIAEEVEVTEADDKIKLVKEMGSKTLYQYGSNYYIVSYSSMGGETAIFMADSSGKPKSYESLWSERRSVDHDSAIKDFVKYKFKKDAVVESTEIAEAPALMGGEAAPTIFGWGKHQFESKFRELLAKMGFERGIVHMKTEGKVMKIYFANAAKARDFVIAFNGIARRRSMDSVASVATQFDKIKAPTGTAAIVTLDLTMVRGENYEETLLSVMEDVSVEGTITEGYERVILNYLEDAGFKKGDAWFENGILYVAKRNLIARAKTALENKRDIYKLPEIRIEEGFVEMSEEDHGLRTDLTNPKGKAVVDGKGKVIAVYRTERAARKHAETGKPVKEEVEVTESIDVQTAKRRFGNFQYKKSSKTVSGDSTEFVLHGVKENELRSIFGAPKSSGGMKQWSFEHDRPLDHQFTIEFDGSDAYINSSRKGNPTVRDHIKSVFGLMGLRVTTESVEEDGEELTEAQQVIGKYRFTSFTEGSLKGWLISVQGIGEIGFIEEPAKKNTKVSVAPHKVYFDQPFLLAAGPSLMANFYPGTETRVLNEKEARFAPRQLLKAVAMWMDKYGYEKIEHAKKEEVQVDENFDYGAYGYRIDPDGGKFVLYILSYNQGSVRFPDGRKGTVIGRFATKDEAIAKAKKDAMSRDPRLKEDINESVKPKLITPKEMADYKVKKVLAVGTKPNNESIVATCEWGKKKFVQLEKMGKTAGLNYIVQATFFDTEKEAMDEMRDRGFKIHA